MHLLFHVPFWTNDAISFNNREIQREKSTGIVSRALGVCNLVLELKLFQNASKYLITPFMKGLNG